MQRRAQFNTLFPRDRSKRATGSQDKSRLIRFKSRGRVFSNGSLVRHRASTLHDVGVSIVVSMFAREVRLRSLETSSEWATKRFVDKNLMSLSCEVSRGEKNWPFHSGDVRLDSLRAARHPRPTLTAGSTSSRRNAAVAHRWRVRPSLGRRPVPFFSLPRVPCVRRVARYF